jgi:hypothetical protein
MVVAANAQVAVSSLSYSQDFNALGTVSGTWTDNTTIPGWYAANNNAGVVTAYAATTSGSGGGTSSSTFYNLGVSGDPDRAPGGAPSSTRFNLFGLRLVNDTGSAFNDIQVKYDVEQWSDRGTANVTLSYQKFGAGLGNLSTLTGWTPLLTTPSPLPTSVTPVTGIGNTTGLVPNVLAGASALGLANGDELWLRWDIAKTGGQNSTHGIDNVFVSVPEPTIAAFLGVGLLLLGWRFRRA